MSLPQPLSRARSAEPMLRDGGHLRSPLAVARPLVGEPWQLAPPRAPSPQPLARPHWQAGNAYAAPQQLFAQVPFEPLPPPPPPPSTHLPVIEWVQEPVQVVSIELERVPRNRDADEGDASTVTGMGRPGLPLSAQAPGYLRPLGPPLGGMLGSLGPQVPFAAGHLDFGPQLRSCGPSYSAAQSPLPLLTGADGPRGPWSADLPPHMPLHAGIITSPFAPQMALPPTFSPQLGPPLQGRWQGLASHLTAM